MIFTYHYDSPLGGMTAASDGEALTGLWFDGQKYFPEELSRECAGKDLPVFTRTAKWLDIYFSGKEPGFVPALRLESTGFRLTVWKILQRIPYGQTMTYGEIAREIAGQSGLPRMSAQAVGGAVGHNPVSLIIPCHRVVGRNGSLTGYAGGLDRKAWLLELEGSFRKGSSQEETKKGQMQTEGDVAYE